MDETLNKLETTQDFESLNQQQLITLAYQQNESLKKMGEYYEEELAKAEKYIKDKHDYCVKVQKKLKKLNTLLDITLEKLYNVTEDKKED